VHHRSIKKNTGPWLAVLLLALSGCAGRADSGEAEGSGSLDPEQAVASFSLARSFRDTGVKGLVLSDGSGYAYRMVDAQQQKIKFVAFKLSAAEQAQLIRAFNKHDFLKLPPRLSARVFDGTAVTIRVAGRDDSHEVYNYMHDNRDFRAVQEAFAPLLRDQVKQEAAAKPTEFLQSLAGKVKALPKDSARRKLAREWLHQAARVMIVSEIISPEEARELDLDGLEVPRDDTRKPVEKPAPAQAQQRKLQE